MIVPDASPETVSQHASGPTLDYATPRLVEPAIERFNRAIGLTVFAGGIAICIVAGFAVSRSVVFVVCGLFWLLCGGILTLGAEISGVLYAWSCHAARYPEPHTRRRAAIAVIVPLCNVLLAIACIFGAFFIASMFDHHGGGGD